MILTVVCEDVYLDPTSVPGLLGSKVSSLVQYVAQLASALPNTSSGLAQHPPNFSCGLDGVETSNPLPVLSSGSRADFQVCSHEVATLVLLQC